MAIIYGADQVKIMTQPDPQGKCDWGVLMEFKKKEKEKKKADITLN